MVLSVQLVTILSNMVYTVYYMSFSLLFFSTGIFVLWIGKFFKTVNYLYTCVLKIAVSSNHLGMFLTGLGLIIRGIFYIFMTQSHQE